MSARAEEEEAGREEKGEEDGKEGGNGGRGRRGGAADLESKVTDSVLPVSVTCRFLVLGSFDLSCSLEHLLVELLPEVKQ